MNIEDVKAKIVDEPIEYGECLGAEFSTLSNSRHVIAAIPTGLAQVEGDLDMVRAYAALLVHRYNNFDKVVAALEEVVARHESGIEVNGEMLMPPWIERAKAVLVAVKEVRA